MVSCRAFVNGPSSGQSLVIYVLNVILFACWSDTGKGIIYHTSLNTFIDFLLHCYWLSVCGIVTMCVLHVHNIMYHKEFEFSYNSSFFRKYAIAIFLGIVQ